MRSTTAVVTLWTDWETKRLVPIYQRGIFGGDPMWTAEPKSLTGPGEPGPGDAVLLYSTRDDTCGCCRRALAPWLEDEPDDPVDVAAGLPNSLGQRGALRVS